MFMFMFALVWRRRICRTKNCDCELGAPTTITMAEKKISFGFSKIKKPALLPGASGVKKPDVQLIQCLEGQTIKILG